MATFGKVVLGFFVAIAAIFVLMIAVVSSRQSLSDRVAKAKAAGLKTVNLDSFDEGLVKSGIGSRLKDPASGIFGPFKGYIDDTGGVIVCGTVNARNGFGGYTGDVMFYGLLGDHTFLPITVDGVSSTIALDKCLQNSIAAVGSVPMSKLQTNDRDRDPSKGWGDIVVNH